ncbi:MAG: YbjN domain-containing protein [Dermabacter sp.]|nr:YbjN domain-containing protein [Dermabacter sp.]
MSPQVRDPHGPAHALTAERLKAALTRLGYSFVEDEENPDILRARFDAYPFTFAITGEHSSLLVVRGRWDQLIPVKLKMEAARVCNHWNMERLWPKVYVRREGDGALGVYGENVFDFHHGASDDALDRALRCSLTTAITFFRNLNDELPDENENAA